MFSASESEFSQACKSTRTLRGWVNGGRRIASNRSVATRNMDKLIGMCRMVVADGAVEDQEARLPPNWI